ncbi:MAG: acyl-CoA dehydrogenase family protein [Acidimicrobiales bacterium]|jgi:alkylation response protein AidB-like acyl-CoA dehydrogenase
MSDFSMELNEDQLQVLRWVHDFAENVVRPAAHEWDEREETPWPIIEEAARIGLYSFDFVANCFADPTGLLFPLVNEELAWGDAGIALALLGSTLGVAGIVAAGTPEQVAEWAPRCFGHVGGIQLTALCVSEVDAGPDLGGMRTRAEYDAASDTWTLNGTKTWVTNGGIADIHLVAASAESDLDLGVGGQAFFIVPPKTPGLAMGRKFQKMGMRASHTAEVVLHDVTVPGRCLLGGKDRLDERIARAREVTDGNSSATTAAFEATRPAVAAQAVGIARAAYEYALDYAKQRKTFGRPIIERQAVAFKLADMRTRIDASRLLYMRAASMVMSGTALTAAEGSMAKLFAGETAVWVSEQAIQILGACGYSREYPVERWHRDSKAYTIFEGTSEIQRLVIARAISGVDVQ